MESKQTMTLGLDLGTNSIGWALVGEDQKGIPNRVIATGVRIFQEAVEAKTRTPKNWARRDARSARRRNDRRNRRKQALKLRLQAAGLLPGEPEALLVLMQLENPYHLRKQGLEKKLGPHQIGRAIYHLNQRRGFLSNRKSAKKEDEKGAVKEGISSLAKEIETSGARTLGEFLALQPKQRGRYTAREMFSDEFRAFISAQRRFHSTLLTPDLEADLFRIIFFQRPLKVQKHLIGHCTFEHRRPRASIATLAFQRFRIRQDLNHLEVRNPETCEWRKLSLEERAMLYKTLQEQKGLKWGSAKKKIHLHDNELFNLEQGKKSELVGNRTSVDLQKAIGKPAWQALSEEQRDQLVTDLLTIDHAGGFLKRMREHWGFDEETAQKLAELELENGYARLSMKALNKILPHLEQGLRYDEACKAAGYHHALHTAYDSPGRLVLSEPPNLRNPVVQKALWEVRKVVNNLIREYGKPEVIRIEMAREMKMTRIQKQEYQKKQTDLEKKRKQTIEILQKEFGIHHPSRADIEKFHLWEECNETCPYTGKPISRQMLFSSGEVDVEHIIPYSRCLDDSYMNKSLCIAVENRAVKRNQTPYEAYNGDPEKYAAIHQRLTTMKFMPHVKKRKFEQKEVKLDDFIERQLNDTRYIAVEVKDYLCQLGSDVQVSKGQATAALRRSWDLNRILAENTGDDGPVKKSRADHRHHAIDAAVIAVTTRGLLHYLSRQSATSPTGRGLYNRDFTITPPWESFSKDLRANIESIVVSHAPLRKLSGALHEETVYGIAGVDEKSGKLTVVYRVRLDGITAPQIEKIRDKGVLALVKERVAQVASNPEKPSP
ncbi:MAG: type II CRISPR RNA-guided endonuclease Cas9, partial [bacterium]